MYFVANILLLCFLIKLNLQEHTGDGRCFIYFSNRKTERKNKDINKGKVFLTGSFLNFTTA